MSPSTPYSSAPQWGWLSAAEVRESERRWFNCLVMRKAMRLRASALVRLLVRYDLKVGQISLQVQRKSRPVLRALAGLSQTLDRRLRILSIAKLHDQHHLNKPLHDSQPDLEVRVSHSGLRATVVIVDEFHSVSPVCGHAQSRMDCEGEKARPGDPDAGTGASSGGAA